MADLEDDHAARPRSKAMKRGLGVNPSRYFTGRRESFFFDYVKDELIKEYGAKTVRQGGLRVDTTIDLKKQQAARAAISGRLAGIGPSSAIVTIDPKNGYIKAMASSSDYGKSKFNLAAQGHRQPGSTFKIMALMTALRKGVDPRLDELRLQAAEVQRPAVGPDRRPDLRGTTTAARSASSRRRSTPTTRSTCSSRSTSARPRSSRPPTTWASRRTSTATRRSRSAASRSASRRSRWPTRTPRSPPAAIRNRPTAITKITFPDGKLRPAAALQGQAHEGVRGRRDRRGDADPRQEHPGRHRDEGQHRLPRGRQDRHHRRVQRRVVRRLHPAPGDRRPGSATPTPRSR